MVRYSHSRDARLDVGIYTQSSAKSKNAELKRKSCPDDFPKATRVRSNLLNKPQRDNAASQKARYGRGLGHFWHMLTETDRSRDSAISPLLRLPPELRLMIYNLLFEGDLLVTVHFVPGKYKYQMVENKRRRVHVSGGFRHRLGYFAYDSQERLDSRLLYTCRQIYDEAATFLYARKAFFFDCERNMRIFFRRLRPTQKEAVRRFIVGYARPMGRVTVSTEWKYKGKGLVDRQDVWIYRKGLGAEILHQLPLRRICCIPASSLFCENSPGNIVFEVHCS